MDIIVNMVDIICN